MTLSSSNYLYNSTAILVLLLTLNFNLCGQIQWAGDTTLTGDIYRTGNVGIGTTTPSAKLEINTGITQLRLDGDADIYGYDINVTKTGGWARNYSFSSNGGLRAEIGAYGVGDALNYLYFSTNYSTTDPKGYKDPEMVITKSGYVGIGLTAPQGALHIKGDDHLTSEIRLENSNSNAYWAITPIYNSDRLGFRSVNSNYDEVLSLLASGKVGVGTTTPSSKLDVIGQDVTFFSKATENIFYMGRNENEHFKMKMENHNGYLDFVQDADGNNSHIFYIRNMAEGTSPDNDIRFQTSSLNRLTIKSNGNIGIGTTEPGSYKLAVEGTIGARSVKVTTANWADYVFAPSYELMSLPETEAYIQENQHLPNIPSAAEVKENGFHLEEMDAKLLAKIEELTLYAIQREKEVKALKKQLEEIKTLLQKIKQ